MPARWRIDRWPECVKHEFLSHCAEDRDDLVVPVYDELARRGIIPWIDRDHYPIGRDAMEALREELLRCRRVEYFITPAMISQGRGWASAERALTEVMQHCLDLAHVELPLLFTETADPPLHRSLWRSIVDKGVRCPHACGTTALSAIWGNDHVAWAADQIERFIRQEEQWATELELRFSGDSRARRRFQHEKNLLARLLGRSPRRLSIM